MQKVDGRIGAIWVALAMLGLSGCGAIYPEVATPLRAVPVDRELEPPPPEDLFYLGFESAKIPDRTRDGRRWDRGGNAPDPFALLLVDDVELFRTSIQPDTLTPTWPDQVRGNFRIPSRASVVVELWDDNPLTPQPICHQSVRDLAAAAGAGERFVNCDSGARVTIAVQPAKARLGVGFFYELRTGSIFISRVISESPAGRARLREGDEILAIQGRAVNRMGTGEAQSLINAHAPSGLVLKVRGENGRTAELRLRDGPVYPVKGDGIPIN